MMKKALLILALLAFVGVDAQISQTFKNVTVNDTLKTASDSILLIKAHLVPTSDSSLDLGTDPLRWNKIYADTLDANVIDGVTYPDSSVLFVGSDGKPTTDSANIYWKDDTKSLVLRGNNIDWGVLSPANGLIVFPDENNPSDPSISVQNIYTASPYFWASQSLSTFIYGTSLTQFDSASGRNITFEGSGGIGTTETGTSAKGNSTGVFIGNHSGIASGTGTKVLTGVGLISGQNMSISASSDIRALNIEGNFTRTAGNPIWTAINISPTLTMTTGAAIKRGVYINTQFSGVISGYRGLEITNNTGHQLYLSGQAPNFINSRVGIGTSTPTDTLTVNGTAAITQTPEIAVGAAGVSFLVTDATTQVQSMPFEEGVYLPVDSGGSNVDGVTPDTAFYSRVGNIVTVSGVVEIDPTTTATPTFFYMNLPIFQTTTNTNRTGGNFSAYIVNESGAILSDGTTPTSILFQYSPTATGANNFSYTYSYRIQ